MTVSGPSSSCNESEFVLNNRKYKTCSADTLAYINYSVYLCSRKSGYCAGKHAINTLKKSNLAFKNEAIEVSFRSVSTCADGNHTAKGNIFFTYTLFLKIKN